MDGTAALKLENDWLRCSPPVEILNVHTIPSSWMIVNQYYITTQIMIPSAIKLLIIIKKID